MTISQTKLAQHYGPLTKQLESILTEAKALGASTGVQRIELICNQYEKLSSDTAYRWIDPGAFQQEIEDAQSHKIELWHIARNCISLMPLILTWFALFFAANGYQHDVLLYPNDVYQPFLRLWQDGFHHTTAFTFALAAMLDVTLLLLYLSFIVLTFFLERRAHIIASQFGRRLQVSIEDLMQAIATDGITPIASDADVDKVANAIQKVVEKAIRMNEQIVQTAQQSIEQVVQAAQQTTQQAMQSTQQSNQQAVQAAQQSIDQVLQAIQQSNQQAVQAMQQTTEQIVQAAQRSSEQLVQTAQQTITDTNDRVETLFNSQIMPMMTTFNSDMIQLHNELGNYQNRLNDLTVASKQISNASSLLVTNADRYITIGKEISDQIMALNTTQQQVLAQIGSIAGNISSAASDMSNATASMNVATTSMSTATKAVETVAEQMTTGIQMTVSTMTNQVGRATQSLGQVGTELQTTSYYLQKAAVILSSLQFSSRGGLIGWFFSRQYNRRKRAGVVNQ